MWSILHLPAINETGEALWPEYFPLEKLEKERLQQGETLFNCMFQGRPEGLSGILFKSFWFTLVRLRVTPTELEIVIPKEENGEDVISLNSCLIYQFWDLAISSKQTADYTVCLTLALHPETRRHFVIDVERGHWSFHETQQNMARLADYWHPHTIGIESTAYQAAAVQEAQRTLSYPITAVKVERDKVTRARLPAQLAESGQVYVVRSIWTDRFLDEVCSFPSGRYDDQTDSLSGACSLAQTYVRSEFVLF